MDPDRAHECALLSADHPVIRKTRERIDPEKARLERERVTGRG